VQNVTTTALAADPDWPGGRPEAGGDTNPAKRRKPHLTVQGAAQTLFLLLVVWWAWIYTTWMTNWFDPDSVPVRLTLLMGMLGSGTPEVSPEPLPRRAADGRSPAPGPA
jgi:hypothetical protein